MTSTNCNEVLKKLRSNNLKEIHFALTFLNSSLRKEAILQSFTSDQHAELCGLLFGIFGNSCENQKCKDWMKVNKETQQAFLNMLEPGVYKNDFFSVMKKVDKSEWVKMWKCLQAVDADILLKIATTNKNVFLMKLFQECLTIDTDKMKWLSPSTCIDNIDLLLEAEKNSESNDDQLTINALVCLKILYEAILKEPDASVGQREYHLLVFQNVIPLAYMGHKKQRTPAMNVIHEAFKLNFIQFIKTEHKDKFSKYRENLMKDYYVRMLTLVKANQPDWYHLWCLSLQIIGANLHYHSELINNLLMVEEKAFKSADMDIRLQAFLAWISFIDIFTLPDAPQVTVKHIKLLCKPLNAKNCKTENIAYAKIQVWWHLIAKLYSAIEKFSSQVIVQFLNFCFGPLGETPLLSTKCDLASPVKKFSKAKVYAIEALFHLLAANEKERPVLQNDLVLGKIPNPISSNIFQEIYKSVIHSVGEAVLMVNELENQSEAKKVELHNILWANLISYIQKSEINIKYKMCKELMSVIGEIVNHLEDSALNSNLILNVILPELDKISDCFSNVDTGVTDLLVKLLNPKLLEKVDKEHWSDLKSLMCHGLAPNNLSFNNKVLTFLKDVISQLQLTVNSESNISFVIELWCTIGDAMTTYMNESQTINEGAATAHNFDTILSLIYFPLANVCWKNVEQMFKIIRVWKNLYKELNTQADLITTVKPNEILNQVCEKLEDFLLKENRCYIFISHSMSTLLNTIHYGELLKQETIPPIVVLLRDVTKIALSHMNNIPGVECALKALSSFIITVYGLNQEKVWEYLSSLCTAIEDMMRIEASECIQKEIVNTWETIVLIFRGLNTAKLLNHDFLVIFKNSIYRGLIHSNPEIATETMNLLEIKKELSQRSINLLNSIENDVKLAAKLKKYTNDQKIDAKKSEPIKVVGSFFGKQMSNSKSLSVKKDSEKRSMPPPPEPDSQDYVPINNEIKINVNLLTEHQKECFKQHKDDIPAMYNDLTQSGSRDTQELEEWFKDKSVNTNNQAKTTFENVVDSDANKENKNDTPAADSSTDKNLKVTSAKIVSSDVEKISSANDAPESDRKHSPEELSPTESEVDADKFDNQGSEMIAKKLNFESRDEFPDEADNDAKHNNAKGALKRRSRQINSVNNVKINRKPEENPDSKASRVQTRSSKSVDKNSTEEENGRNLKRKSNDVDSDEDLANKRRRHTVIPFAGDLKSEAQADNFPEGIATSTDNSNLTERTRKEISRLQINMVFDSKMTSKLRSKPSDDYIYDTCVKRYSADGKIRNRGNKTEKDGVQTENNLEIMTRRRRRDSRIAQEIKSEPIDTIEDSHSESVAQTAVNKDENCKDSNDSEVESDKSLADVDDLVKASRQQLSMSIENIIQSTSSPIATSTCKQEEVVESQEDEVVKSSQEDCTANDNSPIKDETADTDDLMKNKHMSSSPTQKEPQISDSPLLSAATKCSPVNVKVQELSVNGLDTKKVLASDSKVSSKIALDNFSNSPKTKRIPKLKNFSLHGRAAHMLNLVTKHSEVSKNKSGKSPIDGEVKDEQDTNREIKEINSVREPDVTPGKKDYFGILKEPERMSSPSGHRQEKMFNNMRSVDNSSPPSKLFCNLKNDGEKISPKMGKSIKEVNKLNDHDYTEIKDVDNSASFEQELPMLEWSSANPPPLTASPSCSILKRQRQSLGDTDSETTPKRKRVSFADPPVSKQMGYEIVTEITSSTLKLGSSYSFPGRKATPYRSRTQSRLKTIEVPLDKLTPQPVEVDPQNSKADDFANISVNLEEQFKDVEESIVDPMEVDFNFADNKEGDDKEVDNQIELNEEKEPNLNDYIKEQKDASMEESETQQDVFHDDENNLSNVENMSLDMSTRKDTNDSTITRIINGSMDSNKDETLEDTVDIQNISNITSDDSFSNKSAKTNSQIAAINALGECDTLLLTDSMFMSQGCIQTSQAIPSILAHSLIQAKPIYPELLECEEPIDTIIDNLVNPLWAKNLSKYFTTKHINTVGDLARLTEQEVTQIPINKSSKVNHVKKVLQEFLRSSGKKKIKNQLDSVNEIKESRILDDSHFISPLTPSVQPSDNLDISEVLTNQIPETPEGKVSGAYGSMILDTSISPPKKTSTVLINQIQELPPGKVSIAISTDPSILTNTQSVQVQTKLEELLDEVDIHLVFQHALKTNSAQNIVKEYQKKVKGSNDGEIDKALMSILRSTMETGLKNACREYGLTEILSRLPTIFNNDKQFFSEILNAYQGNISTKDWLNTINIDDMKEELCKKLSASEILDIMIKVLMNGENDGLKVSITNTDLSAILSRMPMKVLVDTTIGNNKLIPSFMVLDSAIRNNSLDHIVKALEIQLPDVRQKVLEKYMTTNSLVSHIRNKQLPKEQLLLMYEAICNELTTEELIDLNAETLKTKLQIRRTDNTNK